MTRGGVPARRAVPLHFPAANPGAANV